MAFSFVLGTVSSSSSSLQMDSELREYNESRHREFSALLEKQREDLAAIDAEMQSLGANRGDMSESIPNIALYTANTIHQYSPQDRSVLSAHGNFRGSMISLPRSFSSTSFTSNGRGSTNSMPKS